MNRKEIVNGIEITYCSVSWNIDKHQMHFTIPNYCVVVSLEEGRIMLKATIINSSKFYLGSLGANNKAVWTYPPTPPDLVIPDNVMNVCIKYLYKRAYEKLTSTMEKYKISIGQDNRKYTGASKKAFIAGLSLGKTLAKH